MLQPIYSHGFQKDIKKAQKRGKDIEKLKNIITLLVQEKSLPPKYRNHKLIADYKDCFECHVEPDWLLIYRKTKTELILLKTGTHSDLF